MSEHGRELGKRELMKEGETVTGQCFAEHRAVESDDCPLGTEYERAFDVPSMLY